MQILITGAAGFSENLKVTEPISPYAATKSAGEQICYTYCHLYGIRTMCLRLFTVYCPRQRPDLAIRKFVEKIEKVIGKTARIVRKPMQPGDVVKTVCDLSKAKRLFGYVPATKFEDGIRAFVEWSTADARMRPRRTRFWYNIE